jgi:hypothetical protein
MRLAPPGIQPDDSRPAHSGGAGCRAGRETNRPRPDGPAGPMDAAKRPS